MALRPRTASKAALSTAPQQHLALSSALLALLTPAMEASTKMGYPVEHSLEAVLKQWLVVAARTLHGPLYNRERTLIPSVSQRLQKAEKEWDEWTAGGEKAGERHELYLRRFQLAQVRYDTLTSICAELTTAYKKFTGKTWTYEQRTGPALDIVQPDTILKRD